MAVGSRIFFKMKKNSPHYAGIWTPNLWLMMPELYRKTTLASEFEGC